jgi:hypothetical protein
MTWLWSNKPDRDANVRFGSKADIRLFESTSIFRYDGPANAAIWLIAPAWSGRERSDFARLDPLDWKNDCHASSVAKLTV